MEFIDQSHILNSPILGLKVLSHHKDLTFPSNFQILKKLIFFGIHVFYICIAYLILMDIME